NQPILSKNTSYLKRKIYSPSGSLHIATKGRRFKSCSRNQPILSKNTSYLKRKIYSPSGSLHIATKGHRFKSCSRNQPVLSKALLIYLNKNLSLSLLAFQKSCQSMHQILDCDGKLIRVIGISTSKSIGLSSFVLQWLSG
ncbi:MAG: hypothetical protein ACI8R8_003256, partial [Paraglaciecola sp.]